MALRQPSAPAIVSDPEGVLQTQPDNPKPSSRPPLPGAEQSALHLPHQTAPYVDYTDPNEQTVVTPMDFSISSTPPPPANAILEDVLNPLRKPDQSGS